MPAAIKGKDEANGASRTPTIRDVARAVGVGKTTVSLVLNRQGNISPQTRRAVLRAAEQMGYTPNFHAQSLSTGMNKLVGLFSVAVFPGVHMHTVEMIQDALTTRGYNVPLYGFGHRGMADAEHQFETVRTLCHQRPRAIVCHFSPHLHPRTVETLFEYSQRGGLLVGYGDVGRFECDYVAIDYVDMIYQAARHLLDLGHRSIGLFIPGLRHPLETRLGGLQEALKEAGIAEREEWYFDGPPFEAGGEEAAEQFLALKQRPTSMIVANDSSAMVFTNRIGLRAGLRVPQDVSVVGQDDMPGARYSVPALTTVSHPAEDVVRNVEELLCSRLDGSYTKEPRHVMVRGRLQVRESADRV